MGFSRFLSQHSFDPCYGASKGRSQEQARTRGGGTVGYIRFIQVFLLWEEETLQPSDEGRKALHRSPENQLWSRLGPCQSRWPRTTHLWKGHELLPLLPKGVIMKIKGNIISFNAKPAARVVIFLLLCLFHFPLVARHPFTSVKILKDDDLTQTSFRLSVFSFVQSHFCLSTYSWLFSLSLLEIWSLPCVGPVHTPPLTWSQASLDQTLKFSWLISCLPLTHRAPEARRMEAAHCWAEGPCWGIWGAGDQRPLLAALVLERVPGCCPY